MLFKFPLYSKKIDKLTKGRQTAHKTKKSTRKSLLLYDYDISYHYFGLFYNTLLKQIMQVNNRKVIYASSNLSEKIILKRFKSLRYEYITNSDRKFAINNIDYVSRYRTNLHHFCLMASYNYKRTKIPNDIIKQLSDGTKTYFVCFYDEDKRVILYDETRDTFYTDKSYNYKTLDGVFPKSNYLFMLEYEFEKEYNELYTKYIAWSNRYA